MSSFLPGGGEFAHQKNCPGVLPGGWSGLELTDTLDFDFDFKFNDILAAVIKISVSCLFASSVPFEESLKFLFIKSVKLFKHTGVLSAALKLTLASEHQWKLGRSFVRLLLVCFDLFVVNMSNGVIIRVMI